MERHPFRLQLCLEVVLVFSVIRVTMSTLSNAQDGFVSIDCGSTQDAYIDDNGLNWVNDGKYISTGMNGGFDFEVDSSFDNHKALQNFRYFPEPRNKYCYTLPTRRNTSYLLRATHYYNATEALVIPTLFNVSINATVFFTQSYQIGATNLLSIHEAVFYSPGGDTYFCLTPIYGVPFISTIELRPLDSAGIMYSYNGSTKQFLYNLARYNVGAALHAPTVRFPDDAFDRYWMTTGTDPWVNAFPISQESTPPDNITSAAVNNVPPKVMQDAWAESSPSGEFWAIFGLVHIDPATPSTNLYVALYFLKIGLTSSQSASSLTVTLDGVTDQHPVSVSAVNASMRAHPNFVLEARKSINVSLSAVPGSGSGLVLNAMEVYAQFMFNFSTTTTQDDQTIQNLKEVFNLTDWEGDPCTPVPYDWLECASFMGTSGDICVSNSSVDSCSPQQEEDSLTTSYSVTSLTLANLNGEGFRRMTSEVFPNTSNVALDALTELSITHSGVDNTTFQFLVKYFVGTELTKLDLSNNAISNFPADIDWDGKVNLAFLNLSNNALVGELPLFEDLPFGSSLQELNLRHNAMSSLPKMGTTTKGLGNTTMGLVVLDLSSNNFSDEISSLDEMVSKSSRSLRELNVSHNRFTGTFSSALYFSNWKSLRTAIFAGNQIDGTLDLSRWLELLQEAVSNPSNASVIVNQLFSFVNNSIKDITPSADVIQPTISALLSRTALRFVQKGVLLGGNPYCNHAKSQAQLHLCRHTVHDIIPAAARNQNHSKLILILATSGGVLALVGGCVLLATIWKLRKQVDVLRDIQQALADQKVQPPFYSYNDLKLATRDFHKDNKLGHGAFGVVYLGVLADGTKLGVKKLSNSALKQVLNDFLNEVVLITGIKHRNLVQLKGCCVEDNQRILVYEYAEKGNLAEALWGSKTHGCLDWEQRWDICVGIARGLSYLHEEIQPCIIHRDIKPANILLGKNYEPKIADFGLARPFLDDQSRTLYTRVAGTLGYFAPEYASQGRLTKKADVYSYGMVVLEVVSGRKCIDTKLTNDMVFLNDWAHDMQKGGKLLDLLQSHLRGTCGEAEVIRAINIALLCVQSDPVRRPTMSEVVTMFSKSLDGGYHYQPDFKSLLETNNLDLREPALERVIREDSNDIELVHCGVQIQRDIVPLQPCQCSAKNMQVCVAPSLSIP